MASVVDICNLALAHLGDSATVSNIDPPEGSAQAEHCARFYPIARDSLLEMHPWSFATRRAALADLGSDVEQWDYAYAPPADMLAIIAILPPDAISDSNYAAGAYTPQDYSCEINATGASVIYTNQEAAIARYVAFVSDSSRFSPSFTMTLSWHLASLLAGPILKGEAGAAEAKRCAAVVESYLAKARESDAGDRRAPAAHSPAWIAGR